MTPEVFAEIGQWYATIIGGVFIIALTVVITLGITFLVREAVREWSKK